MGGSFFAAIKSPSWHRNARARRSRLRKRIKRSRLVGFRPAVPALLHLSQHHSRPLYRELFHMGKQAQWSKAANSGWGYWQGSYQSWGKYKQDKGSSSSNASASFPNYQDVKVAAETSKNQDVISQDALSKHNEGADRTLYIRDVQKALNLTRKLDNRGRRLAEDKETRMAQWAQYQQDLRDAFLQQLQTYNKDIAKIDAELEALQDQKLAAKQNLTAIMEGKHVNPVRSEKETPHSTQDMAAWQNLIGTAADMDMEDPWERAAENDEGISRRQWGSRRAPQIAASTTPRRNQRDEEDAGGRATSNTCHTSSSYIHGMPSHSSTSCAPRRTCTTPDYAGAFPGDYLFSGPVHDDLRPECGALQNFSQWCETTGRVRACGRPCCGPDVPAQASKTSHSQGWRQAALEGGYQDGPPKARYGRGLFGRTSPSQQGQDLSNRSSRRDLRPGQRRRGNPPEDCHHRRRRRRRAEHLGLDARNGWWNGSLPSFAACRRLEFFLLYMCASGCGFGDTACGWQAMCARELLCPHEERPGPEFFWMNHVASCSAAWVERGCDCRHPVPRCPVLAIAGLRCDPFSACRRQALHGHSAGPQLECSACRRPYVCSLGPSRGSDESLNCQPRDECDEGPSHFRLAGDADKLLRLNPWFHYRSLKLCSRICMPQLLWLHFCCSRLPADWRQEHVLGFFYLADGAVFKLEDLDVPVNSTDGADVLDCTDEGQASLVPFATTPPWLAWMECLATSVSLSWFGLLFAALLRLLCFGMQLKGGERNWDPIVRGGRAVLRGGPMSILIFAAMICSTAGMPNFPDSAPINNEHYHFLRELMLFDRDMQITASMHPAVRPVHNASEAAAPPEPDNFPFSPTTSDDAESGGSDPWKRMAVRVFMYGRTDFYTSVWIRESSSELAVISAIADGLLLDPDQLRVTVVRPQTPSDTVDVAVTPTWWQEGGITFFILEGSEVSRPTYMCTLPAAPTYADLRAAVGPHLVSGISLYWRNERVPINPDAELQIQSGDLLRLRFDGRVRVHLPDIVEALQDVYWARDLDRLGLPENPSPKGRLLVLYKDYRYILRVDENITKDELHAKLARQIRSTTDAERLLLPQGEFEQPAHRGIPLTTVAALCPHASFSTGQHTAVFIDARDLGQPIHFQLHESADLTASDFVAGMDFCPPPGFSVHADGSVEPIAGTGSFSCSTGCCFAIWCDRDNARDHPVRGPSILPAMPGDSTYLDDNVASSEDSGSVRARSRTPRRLAIAPTSQSSGWARAGRDEDAAHLPVQFHAVVYRLQRPPFYRLVHGRHPFTLTSLEAMVHDALFNGDQDWELIPLRPQQDGIAFQFLVTSSWCFDTGLFPCLIDGEWFGIPSFVAMVGPAIRAADVRAILSADWPSGAVIYVLGGHMLDDNEETFVHRGMAVVLRAAGAPPLAYVNTDDKVVSAFTAEQPVVVQPLNIVGDFPDHVACLGKDFADIMFRCETGFRGQMQTYAARHTGYLEEEFHIVSAARDLPDFYCRGLPVSTFLGIQLQHDEFHVGCFIDARDLGYNVKFALLPHSATSLTELFQLAGIDRPPGFAFNVSGVLYTPSSELLIVGQRSVISISVVKDTGVDASDTCSALSFPDGPEGDDDQLDGGGDGHSPDATDRRSSAASEDGNRSGPPSGPVPAGPTQRGGEFPTSCFGCVDAMWKHAFQQDAILYCQQVDTSGSPQPLRTLLELSDPQPRRQLLGNIWTMLQTDGQESCTTGSVSTVQPVPISLEICLPIAASSPPTYDNFDMHYSQCMMPISPAMLHDFDRCIPLGQTRRPPEGLRSPGRFSTWIKQATYGRLPGPDEELVVTSDGAYHPTTGAAGWGIVLSIRQCCDHTASDLVGCL